MVCAWTLVKPTIVREEKSEQEESEHVDIESLSKTLAAKRSEQRKLWKLRDSTEYRHEPSVDGATEMQGIIAHTRGCSPEEMAGLLDPTLSKHMPDPSVMADMDKAAKRVAKAVVENETVLVFGDYDVDGATSVAIVQRYLKMAGHEHVRTMIPNRSSGYGYGPEAMAQAIEDLPDLVLLLDCGTHNHDTIAETRASGSDVVVLDHHMPGATLPSADALVNPHRHDESAEGQRLRNLCTAGLAFMLCVAVNRELRTAGRWEGRKEPALPTLLDLVALGTVCDVMSLTGLNRSFVSAGLKRLDRRANVGLDALAREAGVKQGATVTSFGFHIGPRINAGGRVGTARLGADLLSSDDPEYCDRTAKLLNDLNIERQTIEKEVQAKAMETVDPADPIIVVSGNGWHEGVIGIVAGRLKETYDRPVLVLAVNHGIVKGSGRSIPGVDLGTAIMDARQAGILSAGGGHAMACGLTTTPDRIDALRSFLIEKLGEEVRKAKLAAYVNVDAHVPTTALTHGFSDEIDRMGPYGQGWSKPRFVLGPAKTSSVRVTQGGHAFFDIVDDKGSVKAKAWKAADSWLLPAIESDARLLVMGHVEIDLYKGRDEINFIVEDIIRLDDAAAKPQYSAVDLICAG
jgi:single-stranded-DNA-specific exonuclease